MFGCVFRLIWLVPFLSVDTRLKIMVTQMSKYEGHQKAWPALFECRIYQTGWAWRMGRFLIRRHKDLNYSSLSFDWIKPGYQLAGGETLKKYRQQLKAGTGGNQ